ncbi:bifunctional aldolase/short-chain dehydrogenase [Candidatus Marimicrobium litorale]|uniref:Bifunctional aldolase/short-chain dehydrogenase n=1 Tax=Candidatus Marimicrobium litorale TaxID=2518991 RepID=A0ABT3TBU0_9GAMM|nr:bifunctional aldolase/short-chain dehydrogenase [Candidatus Marimicrobium litorale]MCX2978929.1 bifunctional aldolase/short-chain dehydrogenase [Candidatus Marimicrobium litorale]
MQSLWCEEDAAALEDNSLAMRVYTSRLLGSEENLVMHGGGNTSVKAKVQDFFGNPLDVLYVKGSGWDLKTIEQKGFPALRLKETKMLADLEALSDTDMTRQLRALMLDPSAPSPSVEAILHAILPPKFIDHTHTDAIVTLSNNPRGEEILADLFPDCLILPYIMPGFILSRQVNDAIKVTDLSQCKGIILQNHGVFTFSDDAKEAYENMIELVTRAEDFISENAKPLATAKNGPIDLQDLARIRQAVCCARGKAQLAILENTADAVGYARLDSLKDIALRGPITPDHVIRTKRIPVIIGNKPEQGVPEVAEFVEEYKKYYERHSQPHQKILDQAPRYAVWRNSGSIAFGSSVSECTIISDIVRHTRWAVQTGESLGGWAALPELDIFEMEYWELEQAKLGKTPAIAKPHAGKIAVVTGAYSGIGRACCNSLFADGAVVVGIDINPAINDSLEKDGMLGICCDLTDDQAMTEAVEQVVAAYGGIDIAVCNAGIFNAGEYVEDLSPESWDQTLSINLTATQRFMSTTIPYLKFGVNPSLLLVGSRNFSAPGRGAAAYSVSKAGITQLARVAALELAAAGIRVNVVHPDAVFDTELWTEETLNKSAKRYNLSVAEYKTKNLLKKEIRSQDVGRLLSVMAGDVFAATTGAQIPIDGGSDRVI